MLTYILITPNLDAMGHRWVGLLACYEFTLEYQKGADNRAADALSRVPICHDCEIVRSLLEAEAEPGKELLCEHVHLENEAHIQAAKLAPMHVVYWGEAQEADAVLAACRRWLHTHKDTLFPKRDMLLKKYLGDYAETEEGHTLFHIHNSLVLNKGLLYVSIMLKGQTEGILAFLGPTGQCHAALN